MKTRHILKALIGCAVLAAGFGPVTVMAKSKAPAIVWETRAQFAHDLLAHFGYTPDRSGHSNFTDMSSRNASWGWVHRGIELGILRAQFSHKYGTQISQTEAANATAHLFQMSLGKLSATQWATLQGLFSGSQSKVYLTQSDTRTFLARLDSVKKIIQQVPGSWTLTSGQINTLAVAIKNSQVASYMQIAESETQNSSATLTKQGKTDMPEAGVPDKSMTQTTTTKGLVDGLVVLLSSATTQDSTDSTANSTHGTYIYGKQVFEDDGSGSGFTQDSTSDAAQVLRDNMQQFLPLYAYQNVTVTSSGSTMTYTTHVNPTSLAALVGDVTSSLPSGSTVTADQIAAVFKHISATDVLQVSTVNGQPMVTSEHVHITGIIPVGALPMPAAFKVAMEQDIVNLTLSEDVSDTYTYDQTEIAVPQGLPGYVAPTGTTGSTTTDTTNATASSGTGAGSSVTTSPTDPATQPTT